MKFRRRSVITQINLLVALLLICANGIYLGYSVPYYQSYLQEFSKDDAIAFAKTASSALHEEFYNDDYTKIVKFAGAAVSRAERVLYAVIVKNDGPTLLVHGDGWQRLKDPFGVEDLTVGSHPSMLNDNREVLYAASTIEMVGFEWGTFWVAMDEQEVNSLASRIFGHNLVVTSAIVFLCLMALQLFSRHFRFHLRQLREVAQQFSSGDLEVLADVQGPGEIGELGQAFNTAVTSLKKSTRDLARIGRIFEESDDGLIVFNKHGHIRFINKKIAKLVGLDMALLKHISVLELADAMGIDSNLIMTIQNSLREDPDMIWTQDLVLKGRSGITIDAHLRVGMAPDEEGAAFAIISDITERKLLEQRLHDMAYTDKLTGLPNRARFSERVDELAVREGQKQFALLFMDFDDFKRINDSLGHEVGDELLIEAGKRMRATLADEHELYRLGGDEFTIIIPDPISHDEIQEIAARLVERFTVPVIASDNELHVGLSVGVACFPVDGATKRDILRSADVAMYGAKRGGGRRFQFFTQHLGTQAMGQLTTERQIRFGLRNREFVVEYQPIVSAHTGKTDCLEALIRWRRDDDGVVMPAEFINVAEKSGVIVEMGRYVWESVCEDFKVLIAQNYDGKVAINVSARELQEPDFVDSIIKTFIDADLSPSRICLEFTESMLIDRVNESTNILRRLKAAGFNLSIDDFGTGYSSLSYLDRFPIDILKVDKSFTKRVCDDRRAAAIMRGVREIAHGVDVSLVAEGVETNDQLRWLRANGYDMVQGFLMSQSLPPGSLTSVLPQINKPEIAFVPGFPRERASTEPSQLIHRIKPVVSTS